MRQSSPPPTALTVKKYTALQRLYPPPTVIKYIALQRLLPYSLLLSPALLSLLKYIAWQRDTEFTWHATRILMIPNTVVNENVQTFDRREEYIHGPTNLKSCKNCTYKRDKEYIALQSERRNVRILLIHSYKRQFSQPWPTTQDLNQRSN